MCCAADQPNEYSVNKKNPFKPDSKAKYTQVSEPTYEDSYVALQKKML